MRVELILEAINRATGPIKAVQRAISGLNAAASEHATIEKVQAAQQRASAAQAEAQSGLMGAAATAAAVAAPITKAVKSWNEYEDVLADIGLKADASAEKLKALDAIFRAAEKAVNTGRLDLAKGFDQLMAGGLDFDKSAELAAPLAKVTRATKSQIEDVSKSTVALVSNLQVIPAEVQRAFDVMNQAGKDGRFEMKEMAQFFPKIGARYASMGQTGVKAVADIAAVLQVMRKNVGTSGEAVTNLEDLMLKFTKGPAIKGFEEFGLKGDDIKKQMAEAQKTGRIFETMFEIMQKATGGDLSKLPDIFSDKQALGGATALMQHFQDFLKIREKAMGEGNGSIDRDFATRMGLGVEKTQALSVAMQGLWSSLGQALAPGVAEKIDQLLNIINTVERWIRLNPELAASIAKVATAVTALMVALAALKLVKAVFGSGLVTLLGLMFKFNGAGKNVSILARLFRLLGGAVRLVLAPFGLLARFLLGFGQGAAAAIAAVGGWRVVLAALGSRLMWLVTGPLTLLRSAFMMLGAAMMSTPIGWVVAGIAAVAGGAYLIYSNWGRIGPWFASLWVGIKATIAKAIASISAAVAGWGDSILSTIKRGWDAVTGWFAALEWPKLPTFAAVLGDLFAPVLAGIKGGWDTVAAWFAALEWPKLPDLSGLFDGFDPLAKIKSALEPVLNFVGEWGGKITSAFETVFGRISGFVGGAIDKISAGFAKISDVVSGVSEWMSGAPKVIDPAKMQAGIDKAREYETQIKAIGPAAQQAVNQANSVLAAANFHSHGVRMMTTLAQGIRDGSNSAVEAVRQTVQKIRDHLPHSPAKVGPLSDLDRVQFAQTIATAIERGAPRALAAAKTLAAGLAASIPTGEAAMAGPAKPAIARPVGGQHGSTAAGAGGGPVTVNLTLSPNFQGGDAGDFLDRLKAALPDVAYELGQAVKGETARRERTEF